MASIFDKILKAITSSADPMLNSQPTAVDKAISRTATKRTEQRNAARNRAGITADSSNFGMTKQERDTRQQILLLKKN